MVFCREIGGKMLIIGLPEKCKFRGKPTRNYYVRVYDQETKKRSWWSTGCKDLNNAILWRNARERDCIEGVKPGEDPTFASAFSMYMESREGVCGATHHSIIGYKYKNLWGPRWGNHKLSRITTLDISTWVGERCREGVSPATVNSELRMLRTFFNWAASMDDWKIAASPVRAVKDVPGKKKNKKRQLSRAEWFRLLDACEASPAYLLPAVVLAGLCGFRRSTIMALEWEHLDIPNARFCIPGDIIKNREDHNERIPSFVLEALGTPGSGKLLKTPNDPSNFSSTFQTAARRAGLAITFHDLRGVNFNAGVEAGISPNVMRVVTGWKDQRTVTEYYERIQSRERDAAVDKLDAFLSPTRAATPT